MEVAAQQPGLLLTQTVTLISHRKHRSSLPNNSRLFHSPVFSHRWYACDVHEAASVCFVSSASTSGKQFRSPRRWDCSSDGYKHINETETPFRFDSVKRASVSV